MKLELFTNREELKDYLDVLKLSVGIDESEPVPAYLRREISAALEYTKKLPRNYRLERGLWVLYALRDRGKIIGTIVITEDRHRRRFAQLDFLAIRKDRQGQGLGTFVMREIEKKVKKHSDFSYLILTTGTKGKFHEKLGFVRACTFKIGGSTRIFYVKKIA